MKKFLVLLLLTFSISSFGYFNEKELKAIFGSNEECFAIGTGFLALSLMDDGIIDYNAKEYNEIEDELVNMGEIIAKELKGMSSEEALIAYYTVNCKIPSQSKINSFGSKSFTELMSLFKEIQEEIN